MSSRPKSKPRLEEPIETNVCSYMFGGVTIHLAGLPIQDDLVLELARLVDDEALAGRLETAYGRMTRVLALTIPERDTVLAAIAKTRPPALRSSAVCCCASTPGGSAKDSRRLMPCPD